MWVQRGQPRRLASPLPTRNHVPQHSPPESEAETARASEPGGAGPWDPGPPLSPACGAGLREEQGHSLVREELQGPAARRHGTHRVAAALAEAGRGGRLVVDVHRGVGPLGWRGAGRGAEEAAEAASGGTGREGRPRGASSAPSPSWRPNSQLPDGGFLLLLDRRVLSGRSRVGGEGGPGTCSARAQADLSPDYTHPLGPAQANLAPPLPGTGCWGAPQGHTGSWPQGGGAPRGSVTASRKGLGTPGPNTPARL